MANSENIKNTAQSALRDTKSISGISGGLASGISDKLDSLRDTAERFSSDASPRVREAFEQVSDVAGDLYDRANSWVGKSNSRKYGMVALVATVGVLAFYFGRGFKSSSSSKI